MSEVSQQAMDNEERLQAIINKNKAKSETAVAVKSIEDEVKDLPSPSSLLLNKILEYVKVMDPKAQVSIEACVTAQRMLYGTMLEIFDLPAEQFKKAFDTLIKIYKQNVKGAFSEHYISRCRLEPGMRMNDAKNTAFNMMLLFVDSIAKHGVKELLNLISVDGFIIKLLRVKDSKNIEVNIRNNF